MKSVSSTTRTFRIRNCTRYVTAIILTMTGASCSTLETSAMQEPSYAVVLRPQIRAIISETLAPGAVVVVQSPQGAWTEAFGTRSRNGMEPLRATDYFRVGSITKTWVATVILQLVQEGHINLADPISRYLPNVPNGDKITIEHLLNMRSGLFNYSADTVFGNNLDVNPERVYKVDELLRIAFSHPVYFAPGQDFSYSNTNTLLLGLLMEKLTKMKAEDALRTRLFTPLGLSRTLMPPIHDTRLPAPFARGYDLVSSNDLVDPDLLTQGMQQQKKAGPMVLVDATEWSASWAWTAGMGISTAPELAIFVKRLIGGGYLNDALQANRLASCFMPDPSDTDGSSYCLGLSKYRSFYGHTGQIPGYNTFMGYDPVSGTTVVTWTSLSSGVDDRKPAVEIAHLIIKTLAK